MNDQSRVITYRSQGGDVSLLQGQLLELGAAIASEELASGLFGPSTRRAVLNFQRKHDLAADGAANEITNHVIGQEVTALAKRHYRALGVVRYADGRPGDNLVVRVFDRDLRREQLLGETRTNNEGYYQIAYSAERYARAEKGSADLLVRVFDGRRLLYDPPVGSLIFNAPPMVVLNINLATEDPGAECEYERILAAITPLLDGIVVGALQEDEKTRDITFLAGETGWANYKLAHFAVAQKLAGTYKIDAEFFYALLAENTLLKVDLASTTGVRFHIDLGTDLQSLFYDIVLLPADTVSSAVKKAIKDQFVSKGLARRLNNISSKLAAFLPKAQAQVRDQRPEMLFRQVEQFLAAGKHERVLEILKGDTGADLPELFQKLQTAAAFPSPAKANAAASAVAVSDVLGHDPQIVDHIRKAHKIRRPQDLRRLARLNRADWKKALAEAGATIKVGDHPMRKKLINLHASALVRKLERQFPTTAFAAQLERDKKAFPAHRDELLNLIANDPDFDLATARLPALFKKKSRKAKASGASAAEPAKESLKATQRIFRIAPVFRQTKALVENGVRSAAAIQAMGETQFVRKFAREGVFTRKEARLAFRKAADRHAASALLAGQLQSAAASLNVAALNAIPAPARLDAVTKDFPNLKSLFQLKDYCACEECRSVHSAAAYVVDTLEFLKHRVAVDTTLGSGSLKRPKDVLFQRRPDLGDLDLSCDNTNTPLPYLDVVCELLEEAVAPDPGINFNGTVGTGAIPTLLHKALQANDLPFTPKAIVSDPDLEGNLIVRDKNVVCKLSPNGPNQWVVRRLRQTHGKPAELAAAPEYLNENAYHRLSLSQVAFRLPFDLSHQETRRYFALFDVARADLMSALQIPTGPQDNEIAAEALGLSDEERQLIGTADPANQNIYWNTGTSAAATVMKVVDTFVTRAEISYTDLQDLLGRNWINPGPLFIRHLDNTCNLAQKEIRNLNNNALDRFHRFIRLWKKIGWTSALLDRVIRAPRLGQGVLDDSCLVRIRQLIGLQAKLGLSLDELCNLYDTIPAEGDGSRYAQLFLNLTANGSVNDDFRPENVRKNEFDELNTPGSGKKLSAYKSYLALCLGVQPEDCGRLVDSLGVAAILSEANIAAIYGLNLLARTLHLKGAELLILSDLTGIDPLLSPDNTERFIAAAAKLRAAHISPADLQYLLFHQADNLSDRMLPDARSTTFLEMLQAGYQAAYDDNRSPIEATATADENKGALKDLLAKLPNFSDADLSLFQAIVDDAWQDPNVTPAQFIDQKLSSYVDTAPIKAAQAALGPAVSPKEPERMALINSIADALSEYFYVTVRNALLEAAVTEMFKLDEGLATVVLGLAHLKEPIAAGNRTLLDLLTDDGLIDKTTMPAVLPAITSAAFDYQYRALRLLHKMSPLLSSLKLPRENVKWMLQNNGALGWMELDQLTYEAGITLVAFDAWAQLQDTLTLIHGYAPVENPSDATQPFTVYGLFDLVQVSGVTLGAILAYLERLTGWDPTVLASLDGRFGFSAVDLSPYRLPATYLRLEKAVILLRTLGLDVPSGASVIKPKLLPTDTAIMRRALKARYQESEWLGVLKNIQDPLRQQKRDALVAFLLAQNPTLKSTNDLYDYFLIDVEMCSCMPTSRIVQAHATIQLFVQRCLMGLEPQSVANIKQDAGWSQWKWMANFRVWEANRKIFLYPENWIEPELRDDKSELFTELEDTLQQSELTDRSVENVAIAYLEKLDEIAQLDVMATYYQTDISTMHVFARTKGGDPAIYYYRQFQKERYWRPWTRMNLDISGDHLLAFDRNSRLTLAWPVFTEEANDQQDIKIPSQSQAGESLEKPQKRWKIQLAVSEWANNKWLPKKVSKGALYSPASGYFNTPLPPAESYNFFQWGLGAGQAISCSRAGEWVGSFALTGCKGYPEPQQGGDRFPTNFVPQFRDTVLRSERFAELNQDATDDLAIRTIFNLGAFDPIVNRTPGTFKITYPMQMSLIDWIMLALQAFFLSLYNFGRGNDRTLAIPLGTYMPFFYGDMARTYAIIPGFYERQFEAQSRGTRRTFSDIHQFIRDILTLIATYVGKYQADATHNLSGLLEKLVVDPEYGRLQDEWRTYQRLPFGLRFQNFYHPLVCFLRVILNRDGIPALMQRDVQSTNTGFSFPSVYQPSALVAQGYPQEDIDFESDGAYSSYNWELFFHMPFQIAVRLNKDQRFEEARTWFHYIFNPVGATDAPAPQKYWITKPFFQTTVAGYQAQLIDNVMNAIAGDPSGAAITDLKFAVEEWRTQPFKPHVIARSRPVAYQMAVVLKYIQNLIDWGDNLFRQFTRESVTQATQMYILADKLLGPKPRIVASLVAPPIETYNQLEAKADLFGNALLDLENLIPDLNLLPHSGAELPPPAITVSSLYFCIPPNEKLLQSWDLIADRLFKIRHCQNIDGVESILALFSPPIDPGALVRAAAAGLDVSAFVAGLSAPLPNYRFDRMSQKATELVQQVGALGNALLQAREKRDAERLARLRSGQEITVLKTMRAVKLSSINEAESAVEGLKKSRKITEERKAYYAGQSYMNAWEITAVALSGASLIGEQAVTLGNILSSCLKLVPDLDAGASGFGGTPTVTLLMGGENVGGSAEMAVQALSSITHALDKAAGMAATQGSYKRREDEWKFQVRLADKELGQIDQQIATARIHVDMLNKELTAHDLQAANAQQIDEFMHSKYTNQELYEWMIGQISSVYFKSYQLAFDVAKKAERCFGHELGSDASFLSFGYWDSLRNGLMTADALYHDIKRMEVAYLDQNKREFELTKNLSIMQLDPSALIRFKSTGKCIVQVPESAFELDHPGQYMRRLKSVDISIPSVGGRFTQVPCKLSLISNRYRKNTALRQGVTTSKEKYEEQPGNDERFVYNIGSIQSIATSTGQSDSGLFELNLRDERYLPFEGTGAISTWLIELPSTFRQFDYDTISDVILHLRYTARDGGASYRALVENVQRELLNEMVLQASGTGLFQAYSLRHQFPNEWWKLKQTNAAQITIGPQHLPFFAQGHSPAIDTITWFARVPGSSSNYGMSVNAASFSLNRDPSLANLCVGAFAGPASAPVTLGNAFSLAAANTTNLEDLTALVRYTITT